MPPPMVVVIDISTFDVYYPATDTWTKEAGDMLIPRRDLSSNAVNGKIYAIGGVMLGDISTSVVEEYDTGFVSYEAMDAKGKLPATWGAVKQNEKI